MSDSPENTPISLYGIKNCDTIKKARRWLEENTIPYRFHDYRVDGLTDTLLQGFIERLGWEALLNTRGTTWRKLDEAQRAAVVDADTAKALMLEQPAIIKRPVLEAANGGILLGFKPESYQQFFAEVR
ncbi:A glutathione-dependent thiol reductase [Yersinia nurmii]|uniref:A glutathione-dependent thiol reductase n=1 Tax=Yersinia nurmii TaxID=685706 RepID=A0ABP1Y6D8_9GAMM|nr:ArsC family reductase [Yersinia nurmii]CNE06929.1 A glutathione-dependent thiol reductase [Yersinia nurmii]